MIVVWVLLAVWLGLTVVFATMHKLEGTPWTWPRALLEWAAWPWLFVRAIWHALR